MNRLLLLSLFIFSPLLFNPYMCFAQQGNSVDSLKALLPQAKTDTARINLLNQIGDILKRDKANDGFKYVEEAIALSTKTNFKKGLARAYYNRGVMLFSTNKLDSAGIDFKKAIKVYGEVKNSRGQALVYNETGTLLRIQGKQSEAIAYFQQAADIYEKSNDLSGTADCLTLIANNFNQLHDFDKALATYKKAYSLRVKINRLDLAAQTLAGIGMTYRNKQTISDGDKFFKLAISYMMRARAHFIKNKHNLNIALIDKEIGVTYDYQEQYGNALRYLTEAKEKFRAIDYKRELGSLYKAIGRCYLQNNQFTQAKKYIDMALAAAIAEKYQQHIMESYQELYNYYKITGDNTNALAYHEKFMEAKDSLTERTNFDKVLEITNKYETEKKEQQIDILNKENTIQKLSIAKQKTTMGIAGGLAVTLIAFGGLLHSRNKNKQKILLQEHKLAQRAELTKAVIEAEEKERVRIASDLHDGVGQLFSAVKMNLNGLMERVDMPREEDRFLAEKTLALVEESCKEVRYISHQMMPNMLLRSGIASDVKSFIEKIDSEKLKVKVEANGFKDKLESNVETVLYRVIQEAVNNVIKHARATFLDIKLDREASGISATITDNGVGFDTAAVDSFHGIGLKNITARVEYLKGTVKYRSAPGAGTSLSVWVPVD
ncbi:tetratricopeptide repeat-containing sensor histidine kinase [Mucilaginibacter sp. HD30]